jgi:hypothetical protein
MSAEAGEARTEHVARVLRALRISGRRLVKRGERWGVIGGVDRRRKSRLPLEREEVQQLARESAIVALDAETYVLGGVTVTEPLDVEPWAFVAAGVRQASGQRGFGFAALALQARKGVGRLTLRHVQAGLRLISDAESSANADRVTMDWDAGLVDRQARSGRTGGLRGIAIDAARRLQRARAMTDPVQWSIAWALCVDGQPLRAVRRRFGLGQKIAGVAFAAAMEALANAYER